MVPANTTSLIHNYCGAQSFADSSLKRSPRLDIPEYFYTEGYESLKLTYQLSLIFKPSTKCQLYTYRFKTSATSASAFSITKFSREIKHSRSQY